MKKISIVLLNLFVCSVISQTLFAADITLKKDTRYKVKNGSLVFKKGTKITFYKMNVVKSGEMRSDLIYTYNGKKIVFQGSPQLIYFHENGTIYMGSVNKVTEVPVKGGRIFAKPDTGISFHDNGHVRLVIPNGYTSLNKILFSGGKQIYFHKKNGEVAEGTLAKDTTIKGLTFKKGTIIYFHTNGKVKKGTLAKGKTVKTNLLKKKKLIAGKTYEFDSKGKVK